MTAETPEPVVSLLPAREGMRIMRLLTERGGSMRLKPLLRGLDMDTGTFMASAIDLEERFGSGSNGARRRPTRMRSQAARTRTSTGWWSPGSGGGCGGWGRG